MAVAGPWIGYGAYRLLRRFGSTAAIFAAMFFADLSTYVITSLQLALAHPDPVSGFGGALAKFLGVFALTQLPLAARRGLRGRADVPLPGRSRAPRAGAPRHPRPDAFPLPSRRPPMSERRRWVTWALLAGIVVVLLASYLVGART